MVNTIEKKGTKPVKSKVRIGEITTKIIYTTLFIRKISGKVTLFIL